MHRRLNSAFIPLPLRGSIVLDDSGLPRYWAAAWFCFTSNDVAASTLTSKVAHLDHFYENSDAVLGSGGLDDALARLDIQALTKALESYFLVLKKNQPVTAWSEDRWQVAVRFVTETFEQIAASGGARWDGRRGFEESVTQLQIRWSHLHVGSRTRPERVRSLPADILEWLYLTLDPVSSTNPFCGQRSRWRVWTAFMMLLHAGLRRGELLAAPVDSAKESFDTQQRKTRYWLNVQINEYEDDPRYSKPQLKNKHAFRQIPIGKPLSEIMEEYKDNHRGRPPHSFLLNSQQQTPWSMESLTKAFGQTITSSLPKSLSKALYDQTGETTLTPHQLRHSCAVIRLNQWLKTAEMKVALQYMRSYFGWSRDSDMPIKYARAVFEDRLTSIWNASFDEHVDMLRNLREVK